MFSLRTKAYDFLKNQFLNSNDEKILLGILKVCADSSFPFSFDLNAINKTSLLAESTNLEIQKISKVVLNNSILHNNLLNDVNSLKIKTLKTLKQFGVWSFIVSLLKSNDYNDKNMLFAHLSYIVVFDKERSNEMLRKYIALFLDKNCINNEISKRNFFFWLIAIAIHSDSPKLANNAFKAALSKSKKTGLGKGINNMGGSNLWLLCYAIPYLKGKIDDKDISQYISIISNKLMKESIKGENGRLNDLELADSFYLLGFKKMAGKILLKDLKNKVIVSASDVQQALTQLQEVTGAKNGIDLKAWQKAIDAMPEDGVTPAKTEKTKDNPPADVSP